MCTEAHRNFAFRNCDFGFNPNSTIRIPKSKIRIPNSLKSEIKITKSEMYSPPAPSLLPQRGGKNPKIMITDQYERKLTPSLRSREGAGGEYVIKSEITIPKSEIHSSPCRVPLHNRPVLLQYLARTHPEIDILCPVIRQVILQTAF